MSLIITMAVDNVARSAYFYHDLLQLPVHHHTLDGSDEEILHIPQGDTTILLRQASRVEAEHPAALQHLQRQSRGVGISLDFQVDDLDVVQRCLDQQHIAILHELEDEQHGIHELWLYDPDHYLIILTQISNQTV